MQPLSPANLPKRLAAMAYDLIVVFSLWVIFTSVVMLTRHGHAIQPGNYFYTFGLIAISFSYYAWFWYHSGQTLGLLAWKIKLISAESNSLRWQQLVTRYLLTIPAILFGGLGIIWCLFNTRKACWQDLGSKTCLINVPATS